MIECEGAGSFRANLVLHTEGRGIEGEGVGVVGILVQEGVEVEVLQHVPVQIRIGEIHRHVGL
jgi:hypothetical protein